LTFDKGAQTLLKRVLYILLILTTAVRLVGVVATLAGGDTSLPAAVLVATSLTIIYGVLLLVRRFIFTIRLKHFIQFFAVQSMVFAFNLAVVSQTVLLSVTRAETLVVGSVLDILINCVAIYYCVKTLRRIKFAAARNLAD